MQIIVTYRYIFKQWQALAPFDNLVQSVVGNVAQIGQEVWAGVVCGDTARG